MSNPTSSQESDEPQIIVFGAGSIGGYIGGWLTGTGAKVNKESFEEFWVKTCCTL